MHDQIVGLIGALIPLADDGGGSTAIKTGLIAGVALVLAAVLPAIVGRKEREPKAVRDLRATELKLRNEIAADRDDWRKQAQAAVKGIELRDNEINRLRNLCLSANPPINPFVNFDPTMRGGDDDSAST